MTPLIVAGTNVTTKLRRLRLHFPRFNVRLVLCLLLSLLCVSSCRAGSSRENTELQFFCEDGLSRDSVTVEVMRSEKERAQGLMYRRELAKNAGMLFVFPDIDERSFWMKNTFIPLDMIFLDQSGKIINIIERVPPLTRTQRRSDGPAKYVLELNGGRSAEMQLLQGCRVDLSSVETQ